MKTKLNLLTTASLATLCLGFGFNTAHADVVRGAVKDASGTAPLEGALVSIEELGRSTSSDRFGSYRFSNVPAGDYTLSVSYVGAPRLTRSISVAESGEIVVDLTVGENVRYLDNVLVVGSAAAQAGAINQQRASNALINVIDSDGLGNFPDTTVADSLSRVPGLSIETDQGEGRYVSIRGINTDLISSSINGVRTPSPEDRRGVLLDGVPSDLLDTIEVQKSLTPNVDGDSIGGVINLKTISAFDRDGRFIRAKIEGQYNEITEEISPKGTLTYSETFGDKLGVALSFNYQDLRIEAHNNETGGWGEVDGADFLVPQAGTYFVPNDDYEMRWYDLTRTRYGFVGNIEYRATENTDLYLRTLFNQYEDDEVRNKFEFREFDEEIVSATPTSVSIRRGEVDAEVRVRKEVRKIQTIALGGDTRLDDWKFDYEASYAYAEEDDSDNHDVAFRSTPEQRDNTVGSITLDFSNPQTPIISGQALAFLLDPNNYELDAFEREFTTNEDTEFAGKLNISRDSLLMGTPVEWKGGLKYRTREKVRDVNLDVYEPGEVLSDYVASNTEVPGWRLPNFMPSWPSANLTRGLRNTVTAADRDDAASAFESLSADYDIQEDILAAYGMGTFENGPLTVVAGVRVEQTNVDSRGNIFTEGDDPASVTPRTFSDDYTNVLPSLNVKYAFTDNVIGRAAYYGALVRPAFGEMAPVFVYNEDQDGAFVGNTILDPYEADNFDLSIEFYPTKLSVLSVGVFAKEIDNAIFPTTKTFDVVFGQTSIDLSEFGAGTVAVPSSLIVANPGDAPNQFEVDSYVNVGSSEVRGIEFNYVQNLGDLFPVLDGFLTSANLTLTDSESTLPDGRKVPFLKQSDTIWNIALGYEKGPWDLRVSANFRDDYLDELFGANIDRYTDDRTLVEASAKYTINDNFQVYLEGKNLTDAEEYYYHGNENRLSQYDEFGRSFVLGVRVTY
jgi:TonB-dependent receptor